jgi:hypothetical protein
VGWDSIYFDFEILKEREEKRKKKKKEKQSQQFITSQYTIPSS